MRISTARGLLASGVAAIGLGLPGVAYAQMRHFNLPAQAATTAIPEFARQAGIQIIAPGNQLRGIRTAALNADLDVRLALGRLLRGTGLRIVADDGTTITLTASDAAITSPPATSDDAQGAGEGQPNAVQDIIVTARRRNESLQRVPVAITVASQAQLDQNHIKTLSDLQILVPSLTASSQTSRDSINLSIRGQGSNSISGVSGVVAYLNEVPIPGDNGLGGDLAGGPGLLFDLENVQALKGPQGTLFGRNAVGGALLLQSRRPTNEFGGHIEGGYGNYNDRSIDAAINVPVLDDKLLVRVAFNGEWRDGFTHVASDPKFPNGFEADNRDFWSVRGTVRFKPVEGFTNDTIVTYQQFRSNGNGFILTAVSPDGIFANLLQPALVTQQQLGVRSVQPLDASIISAGTNLAIENISTLDLTSNLKLKNIFGYDRVTTTYVDDFDGTAFPIVEVPSAEFWRHTEQFTEELQLSGTSFANKLQWVIGGFYLKHRIPGFQLTPRQIFFSPADVQSNERDSSIAGYAQGTYDLSAVLRNLKFTAGIRYTSDHTEFHSLGGFGAICPGDPSFPASAVKLCGPETITGAAADFNALTWTLGLDYQLTPGTLVYLTSRRGYRAGGGNGPSAAGQALPPFGPEFVLDQELGLKSDFRIGKAAVRLNVAAFHEHSSGVQVAQTIGSIETGLSFPTANAADAEIWGAEFEASARLSRALQVGGYLDLLSYRYTNFKPGVDAELLRESETIAKPQVKYGLNATYTLPVPETAGRVSVGAVWAWQSSTATSSLTKAGDYFQPGGRIAPYGLLNLTLDWRGVAGSPVDLSLFTTNVLDKTYQIGGSAGYFGPLGASVALYGEPRMYGARLRVHFGGEMPQ